jgi:BlaI family transcriptional regulator, penicillinase repressor
MSRRRAKIFSEREAEVMNIVWKLGKASVGEVREALGGNAAGAYTSIATMLKFLEKKGALRHEKQGRSYYYYPTRSKTKEQQKAVRYILQTYFEGNAQALILAIQSNEKLSQTPLTSSSEIPLVDNFES